MMSAALLSTDDSVEGGLQLTGRELQGYEEFRAAAALYVDVFQYKSDEFALNPNLLSALVRNGGSAVGVFTPGNRLIGFAYGFAGRDENGAEFHYSQAATVEPEFQGRGVGRLLKCLQADVARSWGHRTMRWTFDPLLTRNAHFNFDSLGAQGVAYIEDYYARPETDRILVEWDLGQQLGPPRLDELEAPELGSQDWGTSVRVDDAVWIALPATQSQYAAGTAAMRRAVRSEIVAAIDSGMRLVRCLRLEECTAAYLAVPGDTEVPR